MHPSLHEPGLPASSDIPSFEKYDPSLRKTFCGIAGAGVGGGGSSELPSTVSEMLKEIVHRGPDQETLVASKDRSSVFGQTRLAMVDAVNPNTEKMMRFEKGDRECLLTFNGEIYNHEGIRHQLEQRGYAFETRSDTEVLLKALAEWGKDALTMLVGEFAFAFRDSTTGEILIARDPTAQKPLYFSLKKNEGVEASPFQFFFASEPGAIAREIGFEVNTQAVAELFLHGATFAAGEEPLDESTYANIHQLKPGEFGVLNEKTGALVRERYATLPIHDITDVRPEQEYIQGLRLRLELAIRERVADEVQVGTALSGGVDSSIITAIVADQIKKQRGASKEVICACIYYTHQKDNSDYVHAEIMAKSRDNIRLLKTEISPEHFLDHLDDLVRVVGIHDSIRQLAMYENYANLKKHGVKAVMIGEGADEIAWGYYQKFPGLRQDREACQTSEGLRHLILKRHDYVKQLFASHVREQIDFDQAADSLVEVYDSFDTHDSQRKMMGVYATLFLGFLNKANDRISMANGVEARPPFQDPRVMEYAFQIPLEAQVKGDGEKHILREAFKDVLPEEIKNRPKAPLPAAAHLEYHRKIAEEFHKRLKAADASFWDVFDQATWEQLANVYDQKIETLAQQYPDPEQAGAQLMAWRPISEEVDLIHGKGLRTNDIFKLLTTLVWHEQQKIAP